MQWYQMLFIQREEKSVRETEAVCTKFPNIWVLNDYFINILMYSKALKIKWMKKQSNQHELEKGQTSTSQQSVLSSAKLGCPLENSTRFKSIYLQFRSLRWFVQSNRISNINARVRPHHQPIWTGTETTYAQSLCEHSRVQMIKSSKT